MARSRSNHSTGVKSVGSSNHTKSTSQSTPSQKKKQKKVKGTKKKGKHAMPQQQQQQRPQEQPPRPPQRGRSISSNQSNARLPRPPSQDRGLPPVLRRGPPPRSRSDDTGLRPMARGGGRNLPPQPSQHQRGPPPPGQGRSMSPSQQRRGGIPRPRSMEPGMRGSNPHQQQQQTARSRSDHNSFGGPRRNYPPPPRMRVGAGPPPPPRRGTSMDRSGHSRSSHSTIINSQHSRSNSMLNSRHSRGGSGASGHSRMSRLSLADQKRARRRGQRMYDSLRDVSRGEFARGQCYCSYIIPIVVLIAASVGLLVATGSDNGGHTSEPVRFEGESGPKWPASGTGLQVTIVNAMAGEWHDIFNAVAEDWQYGNPDAVAATVENAGHETDCKAAKGTIKVCNGDYGATAWRGITEFERDGKNIVASSVRMNDHYLSGAGGSLRQYTLCHEIGHALGLDHTREDTTNDYLGGCMAYTNSFAANKHPYRNSYESLFRLYGSSTSRRLGETP